jgi:hypothetical protein
MVSSGDALRPGSILVDSTTSDPLSTRRLGADLAIVDKRRDRINSSEVMNIIGEGGIADLSFAASNK